MYYQHITKLVEQVLMLGLGVYLLYLSRRPKFFQKEINPEVARKRVKTLRFCGVGLALVGMGQLVLFDWPALHAEYSVHDLNKRMTVIVQSAQGAPAGIERSQQMIQQLKAINLDKVPLVVKQTFSEWIDAQEQLYDATKNHQDISAPRQALIEKGSKLKDALNIYQ